MIQIQSIEETLEIREMILDTKFVVRKLSLGFLRFNLKKQTGRIIVEKKRVILSLKDS